MPQAKGKLQISNRICIPLRELEFSAVRAQGPGGQHVNKVSTAVKLRFDIGASSLPAIYKKRLLGKKDRRITAGGVIVITAQASRSQKRNRDAALQRLTKLIRSVLITRKPRIPTKPGLAAQKKRLEKKSKRGQLKKLRKKVIGEE